MQQTRKFLFETSFDPLPPLEEEPKEDIPPPPPPAPVFSLEEKEEAYRQGHEDGYSQGENAGIEKERSSMNGTIQELLTQIHSQVQNSFNRLEDHKKNVFQQVVQFVHQIFQKLFPVLEQHFSALQAKKLIEQVIDSESPSSLKIATHPQLKQLLQTQFKDIRFPCPVTFEENEDFSLSNCRIEWQDSGVERSVSKIMSDIENLLKGFENVFEESKEHQKIDGDDKLQISFEKEETSHQGNGEGL